MGAILVFVFFKNIDSLLELFEDGSLSLSAVRWVVLIVAGGALAAALIVGAFTYFAWRREQYAVTDEAVWHRRGIIFRSQRHARLTRIQSVNITHGLIGRLFKLGSVTIEVAGGSDSSVVLGLLKSSELEELRHEILARVHQARSQESGADEAAPSLGEGTAPVVATADPTEAGAPPATTSASSFSRFATRVDRVLATETEDGAQIYTVPPVQLLHSVLLNLGILISFAVGLGCAVVAIVALSTGHLGLGASSLGGLLGGGATVLALLAAPWNIFRRDYNFTAFLTPEGIRIKAGLTSTRSQTIPLQRVQAVTVSQPFLWRIPGWYRMTISQAGVGGPLEKDNEEVNVLLPVGERDTMLRALWLIFPDLGSTDPVAKIIGGIDGFGCAGGYTPNPARSRWFSPLTWRRDAIAVTDEVAMIRGGRITRSLVVVSLARVQSHKLSRGPLAKRLQLASVVLHMANGSPVASRLKNLDADQAMRLTETLIERCRSAQVRERDRRWLARAQAVLHTEGEALFNAEAEPPHDEGTSDATVCAPACSPRQPAPPEDAHE